MKAAVDRGECMISGWNCLPNLQAIDKKLYARECAYDCAGDAESLDGEITMVETSHAKSVDESTKMLQNGQVMAKPVAVGVPKKPT